MSGHTAGPWRMQALPEGKRGAGGGYLIVGSNGLPFMGQLPQGQEANARLIAAAPDLLEACKRMYAAMTAGAGQGMTSEKRRTVALEGKAAIKKAEGAQ